MLAELLNSFLDINIQASEQIEYVGTELIKRHKDDKLGRLDVRVKIDNTTHIDIEIQVRDEHDIIPRSIFYLSCIFSDQMTEGMQYQNLGKSIALNILCYDLFETQESYINHFRLMNVNSYEELTDLIENTFIELPKYLRNRNLSYNPWASFLSVNSQEELDMLAQTNETIASKTGLSISAVAELRKANN